MNGKKNFGVITSVIALIVSIVAVTIVYAAYDQNLDIKGNATVVGSKWSIIFKDLKTAQMGNDADATSTADELAAPQIKGDVSIENYSVVLKTPGDYVSYNFTIKNNGDFSAKIDEGFTMPTPKCTSVGELGVDADAANVCDNLVYTLNYVSDGKNVSAGDTFSVNEEKEVQLKIYYNKNITSDELPVDDVKVDNLNITIPFIQY